MRIKPMFLISDIIKLFCSVVKSNRARKRETYDRITYLTGRTPLLKLNNYEKR